MPPGSLTHEMGAETSTETVPPTGVSATSPPVAASPKFRRYDARMPRGSRDGRTAYLATGTPLCQYFEIGSAVPPLLIHCRPTAGLELKRGRRARWSVKSSAVSRAKVWVAVIPKSAGVTGLSAHGTTDGFALALPIPTPSARSQYR